MRARSLEELTLKIQSTRERLLASSMICGAAFLGLSATSAYAAAAADATSGEVSEIVVTGTRIPSPNLTSIAPVTTVGNADIKAQGVTRLEDITNSLPQVFAGQGSSINNGSTGAAPSTCGPRLTAPGADRQPPPDARVTRRRAPPVRPRTELHPPPSRRAGGRADRRRLGFSAPTPWPASSTSSC